MATPDILYPIWPNPSVPETLPQPLSGKGLRSIGSGPIEVRPCHPWRGPAPDIRYPAYPDGTRPAAILPSLSPKAGERQQPGLPLNETSLGN